MTQLGAYRFFFIFFSIMAYYSTFNGSLYYPVGPCWCFFPSFFLILGKLWKFSTRISLYCSFPYLVNGRKSSYVTRPRWALSNKVFVCFKLNYHRTQMSFVPFKANTSEGWLYTTPTVLDCHCSKLFFGNCPQNLLYSPAPLRKMQATPPISPLLYIISLPCNLISFLLK